MTPSSSSPPVTPALQECVLEHFGDVGRRPEHAAHRARKTPAMGLEQLRQERVAGGHGSIVPVKTLAGGARFWRRSFFCDASGEPPAESPMSRDSACGRHPIDPSVGWRRRPPCEAGNSTQGVAVSAAPSTSGER
jgi:hypothetical protein